MHERPILFKGRLVRANLEGRKNQTRRVMRPQPPALDDPRVKDQAWNGGFYRPALYPKPFPGQKTWTPDVWSATGPVGALRDICGQHTWKCPYGSEGTVLWVRETWASAAPSGYDAPPRDGRPWPPDAGDPGPYWYRATDARKVSVAATDCPECGGEEPKTCALAPHGWRPSIYMPRTACRLRLRVEQVRIERVQDITEEDAIGEGLEPVLEDGKPIGWWGGTSRWLRKPEPRQGPAGTSCIVNGVPVRLAFQDPRQAFASLWDDINAARGHGWDANPFVWVVKYAPVGMDEATKERMGAEYGIDPSHDWGPGPCPTCNACGYDLDDPQACDPCGAPRGG